MQAFDKLPQEKKERIVNAAMQVFAQFGYRKASVADIAAQAGISKPMIFTYFGTKLGCYKHICDQTVEISFREFSKFQQQILAETDYFERIMLSVRIKLEILRACEPLLLFAGSILRERDSEALPIIKEMMNKGYALREIFLQQGVDESKFKNPSDAQKIVKMCDWLSYGCAQEWADNSKDLDATMQQFLDCMSMLKQHFYK